MVLFFIASSLFQEAKDIKPKVFPAESKDNNSSKIESEPGVSVEVKDKNVTSRFKLLDKAY
jgi:hypothetical protein